MFVAIGIVVAINSRQAPHKVYRVIYAVVAGFMAVAVAGVGVAVAKWQDPQWRHWLLWLEILEIAPFAVFWTAQTLEHWDAGIAPVRNRDG